MPFTVFDYERRTDQYIDAVRFQAVPLADRRLREKTVARGRVRSWEARWRHLPSVSLSDRTLPPADMEYLRCPEEGGYQHRLASFLRRHANVDSWEHGAGLGLVFFDKPYDRLYWLMNRQHWAANVTNDTRLRFRPDRLCPMWHQH